MKQNYNKINKNLIIIFSILVLIIFYFGSNIFQRNKKILTLSDTKKYSAVTSKKGVVIFNEYVLEGISDDTLAIDNKKVYRKNEIVEGIINNESKENIKRLFNLDITLPISISKNDVLLKNIKNINYFSSVKDPEKNKLNLQNILNKNDLIIENPGYIFTKLDGYEYILDNSSEFRYEIIDSILENSPGSFGGIKIVDNKKANIIVKFEDLKELDFQKLGTSKIKINKLELPFNIIEKKIVDSKIFINIEITQGIEELINNRFVDIEFITDEFDSFEIKKSAFFQKDGISGIYMIKEDTINFVPLKVLGETDESYVVSNNPNLAFLKGQIKDNEFKLIFPFEKYLENPKGFNDGDKIN